LGVGDGEVNLSILVPLDQFVSSKETSSTVNGDDQRGVVEDGVEREVESVVLSVQVWWET